ncbi:MAG: 5'-nucleotidase C-terminal domain-containing protein [Thermodesulfobacteriota bacterium]|nr:5'-nucleotidase C-terminal domain-containing protein [Thermodesulfobacteriota bacterium]
MKRLFTYLVPFLLMMISQPTLSAEKALTIVHSNDLHSHFLGASPNIAYTPSISGDDETIGGLARIATVIKTVKQNRQNPVLVVDAGDFLMGSLFHMLSREHSFELRLLSMMGYDAVTLGNHEFDLKPGGLARILGTAHQFRQIPPLVLSNAVFSQESKKDDSLEKIFTRGIVKPYLMLEKTGLRIGVFGLMGKNAAEVAPFASPVTFDDPVTVAQRMVKVLRETEKADMVICLSHSGLWENKKRSEDEILAREVDGIDIIISGHTHTKIERALLVNDTIIVQAWAYGKQLGVMDIAYNDGQVFLKNYKLVNIDDQIKGDTEVSKEIEAFKTDINRQILYEEGLTFSQIIAETDFDLYLKTEESNLGNLIADSIRWYINQNDYNAADPATKVVASMISNGVIRDPIVKGRTGQIAVCDVFRAIPLGIGFDHAETMGYPLITIYVYPSELKKALEILTSVYPMKGSDYFLQVSGIQFTYNPYRMIFDRITEIRIGDVEHGYHLLDYSESNHSLLRIGADIYNATFLKVIGDFTWHVLDIVPKDRKGNPIDDLKTVRLDSDKQKAGIQELKEWKAVMEYIRSFPDTDGDGLADIPEKYRKKLGRNVIEASLNPYKLLKRGTYVTWLAFSVLLIGILLILLTGWFIIRKIGNHSRTGKNRN